MKMPKKLRQALQQFAAWLNKISDKPYVKKPTQEKNHIVNYYPSNSMLSQSQSLDQFQLFSQNRHLRYLFFIDDTYPYADLLGLMNQNQRYWGGRYNPIIPVSGGEVSKEYRSILKFYDPDVIFYTDGISVDEIKKMRLFNPIQYAKLEAHQRAQNLTGLDAFYMISQVDTKYPVLQPTDIYKTGSPLLDFYRTNFGLTTHGIVSDIEIAKKHNQINISTENFNELNKIIHEEKPINQAALSKRNVKTTILRSLQNAHYEDFEIVITKEKGTINDLFYFWNRQLYQCYNLLYITEEQLNLIAGDPYFGAILNDMSTRQKIDVVSVSLTKGEIETIIDEKLKPIGFSRLFSHKDSSSFPYSVTDGNGRNTWEYGEQNTIQTIFSSENLLFLPKLSFTDKVGFYSQEWVVDLNIKRTTDGEQLVLRYPLTTNVKLIIKNSEGRVNADRHICFVVNNQKHISGNIEIDIPDFQRLLRQLIQSPIHQGSEIKTKTVSIGPHDSSNRLRSFMRIFKYSFSTIDDYFGDRFWVSIFEKLCTSEKSAGDSISFEELFNECKGLFGKQTQALGLREQTYRNEENLSLGLKELLAELVSLSVFLQGYRLKCTECSSIFWYQLQEVSKHANCKGCLQKFEVPIESSFYYKLNDLIKNNIFQTRTQRDGNLTVIRTLIYLTSSMPQSFQYSPQTNIYESHTHRKPTKDIDIVALSDGKLIIGEAKHNSKEFSNESRKSLNSLIELAKEIFPDIIIISCYSDDGSKLENAKKYLEHHFKHWEYAPEIYAKLLYSPDYFNLDGGRYFYY